MSDPHTKQQTQLQFCIWLELTTNVIVSCSGSDCNKLNCISGEKMSLLDTNAIYNVESINKRPKLCSNYRLGVIANIGVDVVRWCSG